MTDLQELELDPRSRLFEHKGNTYILTATDPHGFWVINKKGGKTPPILTGQYTSQHEAYQAIETYHAANIVTK